MSPYFDCDGVTGEREVRNVNGGWDGSIASVNRHDLVVLRRVESGLAWLPAFLGALLLTESLIEHEEEGTFSKVRWVGNVSSGFV